MTTLNARNGYHTKQLDTDAAEVNGTTNNPQEDQHLKMQTKTALL